MSAITDVLAERQRQDAKWGEQNHDPAMYLMILSEEVGELAKAALHTRYGGAEAGTMREEAVQVAAVALAIIECLDRAKWAWGGHAVSAETPAQQGSDDADKIGSVAALLRAATYTQIRALGISEEDRDAPLDARVLDEAWEMAAQTLIEIHGDGVAEDCYNLDAIPGLRAALDGVTPPEGYTIEEHANGYYWKGPSVGPDVLRVYGTPGEAVEAARKMAARVDVYLRGDTRPALADRVDALLAAHRAAYADQQAPGFEAAHAALAQHTRLREAVANLASLEQCVAESERLGVASEVPISLDEVPNG